MKRILLVIISIIILSTSSLTPLVPLTGPGHPVEVQSFSFNKDSLASRLGIQRSALYAKKINSIAVEGRFSFSVVEQPYNNAGFVSSKENTVTRFRMADRYGSTGFLAHNYLAGAEFLSMKVGDRIDLMIENEGRQSFWVFSVRKFQATSPWSAYSDFVDLESGQVYSASELFMNFYGQDDLVVLQTCLEKDGNKSWGRIFILAYPTTAVFFRPWPTDNDSYLPAGSPLQLVQN